MAEDKENQNTQEIPDKTPEERAEARLSKIPTDEFKAFMEQEYGAGSFEKHYLNAPAEEKDRLEAQFEAKFKKEPLREAKEVKINEGENDNSNTNQPQDEDWKEKRIKAWKAYAQEHQQEFGLTSDAQATDLGLKVGDTAIHYQDESNVTMGNGEYEKFVKLVQIEKENNTDIINFGNINSEEYKAKLAAACLQLDMDFKNGPEHIDLTLDCFKNIDDATRAKIEAYNKKKEEEKRTQEPKTQENNNQPEQNQEPQRDKEYYKKLYDEKLKEFQEQKTAEVDLSNVTDAGERAVIYAAAKDKSVMAKVKGADKEKFITTETKEAISTLPADMQAKLKMHDSNVDKFAKLKQSHAQTQAEVAAMGKSGKEAAGERINSNILDNYYHNNQGR